MNRRKIVMMTRIVGIIGLLSNATPLFAWKGPEHMTIGGEGYYQACTRALKDLAQIDVPGAHERLGLACTVTAMTRDSAFKEPDGKFRIRELLTYEYLAGEWSALAADHTSSAEELMDIELGDTVVDYRIMTRIAVTNYRHFHPTSVLSWRAEHLKSIEAALEASKTSGIRLVEQFEQAVAVHAFAQHYLQDSFAAGHMGFNRVASSNAAALAFHDRFNTRGRCVASLNGTKWVTFGDGYLETSEEAKTKVIEAAALSFYDFIATFVEGRVNSDRWQQVWLALPAFYKDSRASPARCDATALFRPTRSVSHPAESVATFDAMFVTDGTLWGGDPLVAGVIVGASVEFMYTIPVGYRTIQNRVFLGIGPTTQQPGPRALLIDLTYLWHVANSMRGTLSHEIGIGQHHYIASRGRYQTGSMRALYAVSIEAGRVYIRLQAGAAYGHRRWAPHLSMGVGWVYRSRR